MNNKSLIALLNSKKSIDWVSRVNDATSESVNWTSIYKYTCSAGVEHNIGLTNTGEWCGEYSDRERVTPGNYYIPFLTILEKNRVDFVSDLKLALLKLDLTENVASTFPFDGLMFCAMKGAGHWKGLAEKWLENGYPISAEIVIEFPKHPLVRRFQKQRMESIVNA